MIYQQLQADQLTALKAKDTLKLQTVRGIISAIKNKEIDKGTPLTDEEVVMILQKTKKECLESIDSFTKGERADLVDEAKAQLAVVSTYLPAELSDAELTTLIEDIFQKNKAVIEKNPKALIGLCMKELRGKADGSRIMQALTKAHPV
jgi:uncharacterized protein YqeY